MLVIGSSKLVFLYSLIKSHSRLNVISNLPALSLCSEGLSVRFAGHSKWQNIKHIKAAKDVLKGQKFLYHVQEINDACGTTGSLDPKSNIALAKALEKAKMDNVSSATIKRALDRISARRNNPVTFKFIYRGRNGVLVLIICISDSEYRTRGVLNKLCRKHGFPKFETNISIFYGKGIIRTRAPKGVYNINDKSLEDAIEADAEEVNPDESNPEILKFVCSIPELQKVKSRLELKGYEIVTAEEEYYSRKPISVNEEQMEEINNFCNELEELDDVEKIYFNIE